MEEFAETWNDAALTSLGFFWKALWAFALGYLVSSLIQVLVTERRMRRALGDDGPRSMSMATFFGFISSSCSFAALSSTRSLFKKGAALAPSIAFLLASTNLVIELGIVISIFLTWQFVVGEYVGGVLLILFAWLILRWTRPSRLIEEARGDGGDRDGGDGESGNWRETVRSREGWRRIGRKYLMEWQMVWRDVLIGFTVAGVIAAFVPTSFFHAMFVGAGDEGDPTFLAVLAQVLVGPAAAFATFIGSMGNIPLAAVLFGNGVSFGGVMAFIFSDLVVLPVLRINARYYGWRMALYILGVLLASLVVASLALHYGFAALGALPAAPEGVVEVQRDLFAFGVGGALNVLFLAVSGALAVVALRGRGDVERHGHGAHGHGSHQHEGGHGHGDAHGHDHGGGHNGGHDHGGHDHGGGGVLVWIALLCIAWLAGGVLAPLVV